MELETVEDDRGLAREEACFVCGEKNFFSEGGFYYCSACNTQSQSARLYVDEEFLREYQTTTRAAVFRDADRQPGTTKETKKKEFISTWEFWNLGLRHMADRLVEIGFPDVVQKKIFQLYMAFLIRRKVIFVSTSNPKAKSAVTVGEPITNIYSLYGVKPKRSKYSKKRKDVAVKFGKRLAKKQRTNDKDAGTEELNIGITEGIERGDSGSMRKKKKTLSKKKAMEQDYLAKASELAELDTAFDDITAKPSTKSRSGQQEAIKKSYPKLVLTDGAKKVKNQVLNKRIQVNVKTLKQKNVRGLSASAKAMLSFERFTLKTALILVYVALRQLGLPVVFTDVMRLHEVGILYIDAHSLLDSYEKYREVSKLPFNFISSGYATLYDILGGGYAACIQDFVKAVGIKDFASPKLKEMVPKYMDEFVLPREFESVMNLLNHMFSLNDYVVNINRTKYLESIPEILVFAQIIVLLKMFFGLDDRTEKFQSNFAKLVNQVMKEEITKRDWKMEEWTELFVIEDWFAYLRRRRELVKRELFSATMYQPNRPPTVEKLKELIRKRGLAPCDDDKRTEEEEEAVKSCEAIFERMLNELSISSQPDATPEIKQYVPLPLPSQSIVDQYLERYPAVSDPCFRPELFKPDFLRKRLDFIWHPKKYTKLLKLRGYTVKIIKGDAINNLPLKLNENEDESKVVTVFQPYKSFDEFVSPFKQDCSSSMNFIMELCNDIFPGIYGETKRSAFRVLALQKLVNKVGEMFILLCKTEMIPILTKMWVEEDDDSD